MKFILALFISAIALNSCENKSTENPNEKPNETIFFVNSARVDCTGVGPMKCLQIQESETIDPEGWQLFYDDIEGFDYELGYIYKLSVKKEKLDPTLVPTDGSSIKYSLVKVIEKNKDEKLLLDNIWSVESINGKKIEILKAADINENQELVLAIDLLEMKILGYDGCNNFFGSSETSKSNAITLKLIGATNKMCADMQTPSNYKTALEHTQTYTMEDENLYFYNTNGNEVLKFQKAE